MASLRHATMDDRLEFVSLWKEYYQTAGRETLPSAHNIRFIWELFGAVMTEGSGVCLVVEDGGVIVGGLLWVVLPKMMDTTLETTATGFGTYVRSGYRTQGWARKMWIMAFEELREMDVTSVLLHPHLDNEPSAKGLESVGCVPFQTVMLKTLREN